MKDLTKGKPLQLILMFAFPLLIGNLFQQLYNVVDTKVVGEILGGDALAAVGVTTPIFSLIIGFIIGLSNGFGIVIGKYYGAKNDKRMHKAIAGTIVLGFTTTIVLTIISLLTVMKMLRLLHTPQVIIETSYRYISIILAGMVLTLSYNMCAGILRALGDTIRPLYFLIISTLINVGLDLLFVKNMGMGVEGVAYATLIAQFVSAVLCFAYMYFKCPGLHLVRKDFCIDKELVAELYSQGLAMGFMLSFVGIGTLILQGAINDFGTVTIGAHTAARKISEILMMPFSTLGVAAATFTSQNFGAGNYVRIKKGIRCAILLSWVWTAIVIGIVYAAAPLLVRLVSGLKSQEAISIAARYLRFDTSFYGVLGILLVLRNAMQGLGRKFVPIISSSIELMGKLIVAFLFAKTLGYDAIIISEPATWIACTILLLLVFGTDPRLRHPSDIVESVSTLPFKESV